MFLLLLQPQEILTYLPAVPENPDVDLIVFIGNGCVRLNHQHAAGIDVALLVLRTLWLVVLKVKGVRRADEEAGCLSAPWLFGSNNLPSVLFILPIFLFFSSPPRRSSSPS